MSVLINGSTRVCVQGITGVGGRHHTQAMLEYGTRVVAGVSPGHAGEQVQGIPVFSSCLEAVERTGAEFSVIFVGGAYALDAILEAAATGVQTIVCMEEFVPLLDAVHGRRYCSLVGARLIGPNCNGVASPGQASVGFFPPELSLPGPVGIASRSGTLSYGAMLALQASGIGQSTVIGIGGAQVPGTTFTDCLDLFEGDSDTEVVVLVGEIGGSLEEDAAERLAEGYSKPVVALIAGRTAPVGVTMGHAGAIVSGGSGAWNQKVAALNEVGVEVASNLDDLARRVARVSGLSHT